MMHNQVSAGNVVLEPTGKDQWKELSFNLNLKQGDNNITLKAAANGSSVALDFLSISKGHTTSLNSQSRRMKSSDIKGVNNAKTFELNGRTIPKKRGIHIVEINGLNK